MRTSVCVMDMLDVRYTRTDMRTCGCCIVKSILHKLPWDFLFNLIYFYWIRTICLFIPVEITPPWKKQRTTADKKWSERHTGGDRLAKIWARTNSHGTRWDEHDERDRETILRANYCAQRSCIQNVNKQIESICSGYRLMRTCTWMCCVCL